MQVSKFITTLYNSKNDGSVCGHFASVLHTCVDDVYDGACTFYTHNYTLANVQTTLAQLEDIYYVIQAAQRFYNNNGGYTTAMLNTVFLSCVQAIATCNANAHIVALTALYVQNAAEDLAIAS